MSPRASIATDSPNLARQTSASYMRPVASGVSEKLNTAILSFSEVCCRGRGCLPGPVDFLGACRAFVVRAVRDSTSSDQCQQQLHHSDHQVNNPQAIFIISHQDTDFHVANTLSGYEQQ